MLAKYFIHAEFQPKKMQALKMQCIKMQKFFQVVQFNRLLFAGMQESSNKNYVHCIVAQ